MSRHGLKNRVWEILEPPAEGDWLSRRFDLLMIGLILVSVAGITLRTVSSVVAGHRSLLLAVEVSSVAVFTGEFFLRLWVAGGARGRKSDNPRWRYLKSAEGVVDLIAVLPFYLALVLPQWTPLWAALLLLRVLKLVRYSPALAILVRVLVNERRVLLGALTIMLVLLLFSSTVIHLVERDGQPESFGSIPAAMWWGIATLTTVGYGDVTPMTPLGKIFGSIVALLGIGMFALPAGILSSGFARELKQRQYLRTMDLVSSVPLFEGLDAHDVARISRILDPLVVQGGQVVVQEGDEAASMFFVTEGELEVEVDGFRKRLSVDFFGEIALLEDELRSATVRALTRCQLLVLEKVHFQELLASTPRIERTVKAAASAHIEADGQRRSNDRG